jgi:hypothetical protein
LYPKSRRNAQDCLIESDLDDATTQRLMQAAQTLVQELARVTQTLEGI